MFGAICWVEYDEHFVQHAHEVSKDLSKNPLNKFRKLSLHSDFSVQQTGVELHFNKHAGHSKVQRLKESKLSEGD